MLQLTVQLDITGLPMYTKKKSKNKSKFDYGGKMFSPEACKPD